jgi:hypothetical protein
MPEHRIGTRGEWLATRAELAKLEAEQAERNQAIKRKRRELPWVPGPHLHGVGTDPFVAPYFNFLLERRRRNSPTSCSTTERTNTPES